MLISYRDKLPKCNGEVFLADGVKVVGDVLLDDGVNIWYNTVVRGDINCIEIGANTNIQDNCTIHVGYENPTILGKNVTIGHGVILHGCLVEDNCLIGMGATVLDGAVVGKGSIVGANSLVTSNTIIPKNSLVLGSPARVVKQIDVSKENEKHAIDYVNLSKEYKTL